MTYVVAVAEIAFTSDYSTPEGARVWTDVTDQVVAVLGITITRGRADELSQVSPSTCSLTLKNDDGRFTPERASSPYFPNVKKGKPIRVSVVYDGVSYVRFVGYIDEWPVTWPDGSDLTSVVTIAATSRRARMGLTAPLGSAIRNAYLSTNPTRYWPMDDEPGKADAANNQVFEDLTNTLLTTGAERTARAIAAFAVSPAYNQVMKDGTPGPTDEDSLVRLDSTPLAFDHDIGASSAVVLHPSGGLTAEIVARVQFQAGDVFCDYVPLWLANADQSVVLTLEISRFPSSLNGAYAVSANILFRDPSSFAVLENVGTLIYSGGFQSALGPNSNSDLSFLIDGEIHHYLMTLTGGTTLTVYVDGVARVTSRLVSNVIQTPIRQVFTGTYTFDVTTWAGHFAVHDRALTTTEILARGIAATAASESVPVRVQRLAGYMGVPAGEVDAEATIAPKLGRQSEKGRSAAEVLDEVAASTGGVLYDSREGHLVMQARNHRYNIASAFTLSTAPQEIEADFTTILDDRYLTNTVDVAIIGDDTNTHTYSNPASVSTYGVYSRSISTVSSTNVDAESAARNALTLYSEPSTRVTQVSVDVGDMVNAEVGAIYGVGLYGVGLYPGPTQANKLLTADVGTRFTLSGLPAQALASSIDLFLEGYTENISASAHTIVMNTTPANHVTKWVLGDSTLSVLASTTIPAY